MNEALNGLIGKKCIITTLLNANVFSTSIIGTIKSIEENWLCFRSEDGVYMLNTDYVSRIREYPQNKKASKTKNAKTLVQDK